jgi:DNA-binding transcriptional LysR family regulator
MQAIGIAYLPSWTIAEQLRSGALRAVLSDLWQDARR